MDDDDEALLNLAKAIAARLDAQIETHHSTFHFIFKKGLIKKKYLAHIQWSYELGKRWGLVVLEKGTSFHAIENIIKEYYPKVKGVRVTEVLY